MGRGAGITGTPLPAPSARALPCGGLNKVGNHISREWAWFSSADHRCSEGVFQRRDGLTGPEARSKDVHDHRAPTGVGVDIINNRQIVQKKTTHHTIKGLLVKGLP